MRPAEERPGVTDLSTAIEIIERAQAEHGAASRESVAEAIDLVARVTAETYTRESAAYAQLREAEPSAWDEYMNRMLLDVVRARIRAGQLEPGPEGRWRLLDVGAGHGRDVIRFAREPDVEPVALDNAEGFIELLAQRQRDGTLGPDAVVSADMRDLGMLADGSFHCVRNQATLHHLPVVGPGLGADVAVAESRRVLVAGGVFYVLVKAGSGVQRIDTAEGLGTRFFQLFTPASLDDLLARHGFATIHLEERVEPRPTGDVDWVFALAVAGETPAGRDPGRRARA
jgi:SAM-dependent methyltransferase